MAGCKRIRPFFKPKNFAWSGFNALLPQELFHPRFQRLVGAEEADVCFKLGVQLRRGFPYTCSMTAAGFGWEYISPYRFLP